MYGCIYRCNYMPEDTIGVIKDVTHGETYSKISIAWLDWISKKDNGISIQHALNGGEECIKDVGKSRWIVCKDTVYEFQGLLLAWM